MCVIVYWEINHMNKFWTDVAQIAEDTYRPIILLGKYYKQ